MLARREVDDRDRADLLGQGQPVGNLVHSNTPLRAADQPRSCSPLTLLARVRHACVPNRRDKTVHPPTMSSGRNADTTKLGTSTIWLIRRSTATEQIAYACWRE